MQKIYAIIGGHSSLVTELAIALVMAERENVAREETFSISRCPDIDVPSDRHLTPRTSVPSPRDAFYPMGKLKKYQNPFVPAQRRILKQP